jgi:RNA polymerase subunit RPABC4/transcription elongation factor Spt4
MEAVIARIFQVLLALSGAYLIALWFVLVVWTYRDIEARSRNVLTQIFSTLLAVLFWVPGVLLYLILRPKDTLDSAYQRTLEEEYLLQDLEELPACPECERYVEEDFVLCPHCHTRLREPCLACARLIDLRWSICPYCGGAQGGEAAGKPEKAEEPAARWRATARLRRERGGRPETSESEPDDQPEVAAAERETAVPSEPEGEPVVVGGDEQAAEQPAASAVEVREPIPLVPVPRGRFRRVENTRRPAGSGSAEPGDAEAQVPASGLFTSILGTRAADGGRFGSNGARGRRSVRQAERSAGGQPASGSPNGSGAIHDLDGFNGLTPAGEPAEPVADVPEREGEPVSVRAEGQGD